LPVFFGVWLQSATFDAMMKAEGGSPLVASLGDVRLS